MNGTKKDIDPAAEIVEVEEESSLPEVEETSAHDLEAEAGTLKAGRAAILRHVKHAPASPGVYRMIDAAGEVLYVGKANNIKKRVLSYTRPTGHDTRIERMIAATHALEFISTRSETEALLLEILSEYQVSIPELGTITAKQIPMVFLTSNNTRELSEALKRRCLYLHVDYPSMDREKEIVLARVPEVSDNLADQIARIVRSIRQLDLKKAPSVSETIDWARTLVLLGIESIDAQQAKETLHILLKYQSDIAKAAKELSVDK